MTGRSRGARLALTFGLGVTVILASLGLVASTPIHRSPIRIEDPEETGIPANFNALALEGRQVGDTYIVTLTVAGRIQDSTCCYIVGVLVQNARNPEGTYVYRLSYELGSETSYNTPTSRSDHSLTFRFPLSLLRSPSHPAVVVGLDAALFSFDSQDYVNEGPRETLRIHRLLPLPVDVNLLLIAATVVGAGSILAALKGRRDGSGHQSGP